jgi:hypothetical protein
MATAGRLREALDEYRDYEPLLWQFYSSKHAAIPADDFEEVAKDLQDNPVFLEELHELISEWMQATYKRLVSDGTVQLSYGELADLNHTKQVELFGFCTCEDGPKVWDDCKEGGSE